jgi:hypothetical protein
MVALNPNARGLRPSHRIEAETIAVAQGSFRNTGPADCAYARTQWRVAEYRLPTFPRQANMRAESVR